uniref:Uncharacterized protein n=1 Tax=Anguilla anguilla TaxID=7936 RepID=A0A0E9P8Z2_ANGAN
MAVEGCTENQKQSNEQKNISVNILHLTVPATTRQKP